MGGEGGSANAGYYIKNQGDAPPFAVARLRGHTRAVLSLDSDSRFVSMSISIWKKSDGNHSWLLSASADKTVQLWEVAPINKFQAGWNQHCCLIRILTNQGSPTLNNKP